MELTPGQLVRLPGAQQYLTVHGALETATGLGLYAMDGDGQLHFHDLTREQAAQLEVVREDGTAERPRVVGARNDEEVRIRRQVGDRESCAVYFDGGNSFSGRWAELKGEGRHVRGENLHRIRSKACADVCAAPMFFQAEQYQPMHFRVTERSCREADFLRLL